MRLGQQPIRPLPVILPPLADELLSSWINRHAAFVGVSCMRLLRHYRIEVSTARDLDLKLSRCDGSRLAEVLRCSAAIASEHDAVAWRKVAQRTGSDQATHADLPSLRSAV